MRQSESVRACACKCDKGRNGVRERKRKRVWVCESECKDERLCECENKYKCDIVLCVYE